MLTLTPSGDQLQGGSALLPDIIVIENRVNILGTPCTHNRGLSGGNLEILH